MRFRNGFVIKKKLENAYLFQCAFVGSDTFNQRNGKRIELISLMSLVDNCQRNAEIEDLEVAHFLRQRDDFGQEIDAETESIASTSNASSLRVDRKDATRNA